MLPMKSLLPTLGGWGLMLCLLPSGVLAQTADTVHYEKCFTLLEADPAKAREYAARWQIETGSVGSMHCAAVAMAALGAHKEAAKMLGEVATSQNKLSDAERAELLIMAGDMWLEKAQLGLARQAYRKAITFNESDPSAWEGLARAEAADSNWPSVVAALDQALKHSPDDPTFMALRAAAHRQNGNLTAALADATRATELLPEEPLGWFELGAAARQSGDKAKARDAWLRASQLDPDGSAGEMARRNLQSIDLN